MECGALPPLLFLVFFFADAKRKTKAAAKRRTPN